MLNNSKKSSRYVVIVLFAAILVIGLCIFRDYGVSVDEPTERLNDILSYIELNERLFHRIPPVFQEQADSFDLSTYADRYYGVAIRFPLVVAEDIHYQLSGEGWNSQTIYYMRHLYVWFLYVGALLCFYYLIRRMFASNLLAVSGVLMIFLFGRFFASSFYDIKDMVFVSMVIYCLTCAERVFATERKASWCLLFAILSALAVTSRVVAAILDILILLIFFVQDLKSKGTSSKKARAWLPYALICCAFPIYIMMTPAAWGNPIEYCIGEVQTFSSYETFYDSVYFGGKFIRINMGSSGTNPWDYTIRWMFLTIPIVVMILAVAGVLLFLHHLATKNGKETNAATGTLWMAGLLIAGTLGYQFFFRPVMYNSWRHSYFLFPLIVLFAVYGLKEACNHKGIVRWTAVAATFICLLYEGIQIIQLHPFEMVEMNLIGQTVADQYEGDFWGMSGKQAHEWILSQDDDPDIKIYGIPLNSGPGLFIPSLLTLKEEDQARLRLAFLEYNPKYLENTKREYEVPEGYELVKEFTVYNNVPVCSIYRRIGE